MFIPLQILKRKQTMIDYDLIIIGSGPAGMNACLYASKANLKTLVIERNCPGGKVVKAASIENWLGIEKINGADLALNMFKHSFSFGGVYEQGNVLDVIDYGKYKEVVLKNKVYKCYAVIIAIGTSEKKMGIQGEDKYYGKGVSYCAMCDASLYKNKVMVVIGHDNHCLEEIIYLSKYANKIYFLNDQKSLQGDTTLIEEILNNSKIEVLYNAVPIAINGKESVEEIVVKINEEQKMIKTSVVFLFLGDNPDTNFIERLKIVNDKGYVVINEKKETIVPGIYACGDCTTTRLKQIITASSDGALAATEAAKYIRQKKKEEK